MRWTESQTWRTKETQFEVEVHLRRSEWLWLGNFLTLKEAKRACRREAKHMEAIRAGDPIHKLGRMVNSIALARVLALASASASRKALVGHE
jgi:hypothetical protein